MSSEYSEALDWRTATLVVEKEGSDGIVVIPPLLVDTMITISSRTTALNGKPSFTVLRNGKIMFET
jgi:hypothetical protein